MPSYLLALLLVRDDATYCCSVGNYSSLPMDIIFIRWNASCDFVADGDGDARMVRFPQSRLL
jgi:hypothetical protein